MKTLSAFLATAFAVALASSAFAQTPEKPKDPAAKPEKPKFTKVLPALPDTLTLHEKIECSRVGDFAVLLDIYVPKAAGKYPAILLIHGGGWRARQVEADKPLAERVAQRGYVVAQVAYRLSTDAKFPAALHDCKAALRFLRAHAEEYHLDPERIGVAGGSAGGQLSGLMGMTGGVKELEGTGGEPEQSTAIKACIVMAATMDFVESNRMQNNEAVIQYLGTFAENKALYAQASPITHVKQGCPPTLFLEGEHDTVKVGRPEMQVKLRALGVPTEVITLKGAPHPFWMSQPWLDETAKAAGDWFDKYLK